MKSLHPNYRIAQKNASPQGLPTLSKSGLRIIEGNYSSEVLLPARQVAAPPPTDWLTLTIIARGQQFWFLVNNELVGTAVHSGPTGGSAGVIVNHFVDPPQTPAEFTFTNLVVQALQ